MRISLGFGLILHEMIGKRFSKQFESLKEYFLRFIVRYHEVDRFALGGDRFGESSRFGECASEGIEKIWILAIGRPTFHGIACF